MPRIKQPPKAPSTSLAGFSIAFTDSKKTSIPLHHHDYANKTFVELEGNIEEAGGTFVNKVEAGTCTHLVATPESYARKGAKVNEAIKQGIPIVSHDWLAASLASSTTVDETDFILHAAPSQAPNPPTTNGTTNAAAATNGTATTNGKSKKRSRDDDDDDKDKVKKVKAEDKAGKSALDDIVPSSKAKTVVPVDGEYHYPQSEVHRDDDGVFHDATLNQTESGKNANKFYRVQLLEHDTGQYFTWTRWGRVGETGQSKVLGSGDFGEALREFEKKFKDKTGHTWANREEPPKPKKYAMIEISYEESDDDADDNLPGAGSRRESKDTLASATSSEPVESGLPKPVADLMGLIFNASYITGTLAELDYDAEKMPLGKLSKKTVLQGYEVLKDLSILIGDSSSDGETIANLSNRYFSLIPHAFGRNRPPVISRPDMVKKEVTLLENLTDLQLADQIMKNAKTDKKKQEKMALADRQYQGLNMEEMDPLDHKSNEFRELSDYLIKSAGSTHYIKYQVQDIFRIERKSENDRFNSSKYAKLDIGKSDRRLLWHGSRTTNFGGILSQGLRIAPPEAPVSGYMFGKGIYLADISTKSANYCASHSSGDIGLLLLCEAELGNPSLKLKNAAYDAGEQAAKAGCISTWGVGGTAPKGWKDAVCVNDDLEGVLMPDVKEGPGQSKDGATSLLYDEFICYSIEQVRLRYLLRVKMN